MHPSSMEEMRSFVAGLPKTPLRIADVGSCDVNGSYRSLFTEKEWKYVGLDHQPGRGVDIVVPEMSWDNVQENSFDVVISGQTLEHTRYPWLFVKDLARIAKPGGTICVIAPYQWEYHAFPIDCWRVFPDGMKAVMEWNNLKVVKTYMNHHNDTVGIARK